jgi:hypothetical protein
MVFFFLSLSLVTSFLYGIGTVQVFRDATQLLLLRLAVFLGVFLAVSGVFGFFLRLFSLVIRRAGEKNHRFPAEAAFYLFAGLFGLLFAALAVFISVVAGGNAA